MRLKPIAISVGVLALLLRFYLGDYDQADRKLEGFYAQMLSADFAGARKSIDEAIGLYPFNSRYYGWRAYLLSQKLPSQCTHGLQDGAKAMRMEDQSAIQLAMADYRKALELNARDAVAHHNLGWLEHLLGEDTAAEKDWAQAVQIDPGNAIFHLSLGMFLDETGDRARARDEYQNAIELSPSIVDSPFFAKYQIRDKDGADSVVAAVMTKLDKKLESSNDPILEARLGKLCLFQDDLQRASKLLEDAARQLPNLPLVWMNLGEVRQRQGKWAEAADCYNKAMAVNDTLAGPYLRMGELQLQSGQKAAAAANFSKAIQLWQRVNPITAAHNNRLYIGPRQRIDDLLPTTLVWHTTPCEVSQAWAGLAQIYPAKLEYAKRVHSCEELPSPHQWSRE